MLRPTFFPDTPGGLHNAIVALLFYLDNSASYVRLDRAQSVGWHIVLLVSL